MAHLDSLANAGCSSHGLAACTVWNNQAAAASGIHCLGQASVKLPLHWDNEQHVQQHADTDDIMS